MTGVKLAGRPVMLGLLPAFIDHQCVMAAKASKVATFLQILVVLARVGCPRMKLSNLRCVWRSCP